MPLPAELQESARDLRGEVGKLTPVSFAYGEWSLPTDSGTLIPMSTNAENLGRCVKERRANLELTQLEVWMAGGPSNTTLTTIENGLLASLTRTTARKLDAALQWAPGSARAAWEGREPVPALEGIDHKGVGWLRDQIGAADLDPDLRRHLLDVIEDEGRRSG